MISRSGAYELRHDVDFCVCGAERLANMEGAFGLRSTFYLRPDASYYNSSITFFLSLQLRGFKIGLHYDVINKAQEWVLLMRSQGFNVTTATRHGTFEDVNAGFANFTGLGVRDCSSGCGSVWAFWDTHHMLSFNRLYINNVNVRRLILTHTDYW